MKLVCGQSLTVMSLQKLKQLIVLEQLVHSGKSNRITLIPKACAPSSNLIHLVHLENLI